MKKLLIGVCLIMFIGLNLVSNAENSFTKALRTCDKYSQLGGIESNHVYYNILITLNKNKKKCTYKEKIYRESDYQLLTCNFEMGQLNSIASSMDRFTTAYKDQVAKNKIFEAKLTTNGEVFEKYLINGNYCKITSSSK